MKYFVRFAALSCISWLLLSCAAKEPSTVGNTSVGNETESMEITESWYVPADDWNGLETTEYSEQYADYVASNPQGSPDLTPNADDIQGGVDISSIRFQTKATQYSISANTAVSFEITYLKTSQSDAEQYVVWKTYCQNLERWNGDVWERLIDVNNFLIPTTTDYHEKTCLYAGDTAEGVFSLEQVISRLTPGKYRLVAYLNFEPVYAEFELVE